MRTTANHDDARIAGDAADAERLLEMAFAFWRTTLLLTADELGIFAILGKGAARPDDLRQQLGLAADAAEDFLDALTRLGLIEKEGDQFRNTGASARFLDPAQPDYLGSWLAMARAATQETRGFTARLHGISQPNPTDVPIGDRMWREIAALLDTTYHDA